MSDVFVSYAREDLDSARTLAEELGNFGLSVFWDRKISAGAAYEDLIEQEIRCAKAVVVLWSKHSVRSEWVRAEASEAANLGTLVPATLDGERAPMRYRIAHTADMRNWVPGTQSELLVSFVRDVAIKVNASSEDFGIDPVPPIPDGQAIRHFTNASLVCAWLGSPALATTLAYDFGDVQRWPELHVIAYRSVYFALAVGTITSGILGAICLRREFVIGVLQGWLWPVVAAIGQLMLLIGVLEIVRVLPVTSDFETLAIFMLCGAIGPGLLTIGAVFTRRSLARRVIN